MRLSIQVSVTDGAAPWWTDCFQGRLFRPGYRFGHVFTPYPMPFAADVLMVPQWLALSMVVAAVTIPSLLAFFLVQVWVPVSVRRIHNDVAGFVFAAVGVIYGILLSFAVILVWEQWNETERNALEETAAAAALYHGLESYSRVTSEADLRTLVPAYLREVVTKEFPAMAALDPTSHENSALAALWEGVQALNPDSARDQVLFEEIVSGLADLVRLRALRLGDAVETFPGVIWLALIAGGALTMGFVLFLGTENVRAHAWMVAFLAALIGVVLYVSIELDFPFTGNTSIGPERFVALAEVLTTSGGSDSPAVLR